MSPESISPDDIILWQWRFITINATLAFTWVVMAVLAVGSSLVTRRISEGRKISRWQSLFEIVISQIRSEIREFSRRNPDPFLPFVATLFIFILVSNLLAVVPWFHAPTLSLSTTAALSICVFAAVPIYGILDQGLLGYLKHYIKPSPFMMPFHIIGELSRTLALAVRLFGNMMSSAKVAGVLLAVIPFVFPAVMDAFGLLIGLIQAYIFAVLAMVYISSGLRQRPAAAADLVEAAQQEAE